MIRRNDGCCYYGGIGFGGYGAGGVGYGGYGGYGGSYAGGGIRWIYALLILIVIVLQFGRKQEPCRNLPISTGCDGDGAVIGTGTTECNRGLIDNSVLFIIVVFLLVLCAGCWWGGGTGTGYGTAGGYGYY